MEHQLLNELIEFVIHQSCVDDEIITSETLIKDDLGVDGYDGVEFIVAYGNKFNVDISRFMAADYFNPEGSQFLVGGNKKKLTVGHLQKGIMTGKLDEDVING